MFKGIKGEFKTFHNFIKIKGHGEKEIDPNQITNIKTAEKCLYLTFDTCPTSEVDFEIVDFLIGNSIESTIFLNASWYYKNKHQNLDFLKNPLFAIGGHGFLHKRPLNQDYTEQKGDIAACLDFLKLELDIKPKWYRVPYGKPNEDTINIFRENGLKCASWAGHVFDKTDLEGDDVDDKAFFYLKHFTIPGDILIFHINGEGINTLATLKKACNRAYNNGFKFKKLP